ncbi:LacI family DNA-binding transcriptional regulator [Tenuibacillus multivorans]|nr:substrate-binding domain-containing protein [Tenuibacillus multivorans]
MRTITIKDVAELANVSKSTVSQYLNKRYDYMGEATKQRIKEAIEELGYQPNIVARSLKQKSSTTIGVIVANILHEFSTQIIRAIEDQCHELDFHIIVCNADDNPYKEKNYIDMLRAKQVDGLIVFPTSDNVELYQELLRQGMPIVFIDRLVSNVDVNTIMLANEDASKFAVDEFVKKQHERIGIVTTSTVNNVSPRVERVNGYLKALETHGIPVRSEYIISAELDKVQDELDQMMKLKDPPKAILAGNDLTLIEILKYVKEHNISIPDDLSLIGVDDVSFAEIYNPSITTVAQPTFRMGKQAAEVLINQIKNGGDEERQVFRFGPKLIPRQSS